MGQKEIREKVVLSAGDASALSLFFSSLTSPDEHLWFASAIEETRTLEPASDILNYWYYKLRVEQPELIESVTTGSVSKPAGTGFFRRFLIAKTKAVIQLAAFMGAVTGVLLWIYVHYGTAGVDAQISIATFTLFLFAGIWLLFSFLHRPPAKAPFVILGFAVLFLGTYAVQLFGHFGTAVSGYQLFALILTGFLMLGFEAFGFRSRDLKMLPVSFEKFVSKIIEIAAMTALLSLVWMMICGLGIGLLALINIPPDGDVVSFLMFVPSCTCGFIALALAYDSSKPVYEQSSIVDGSGLLSQLSWLLSFVIGGFLLMYIAILVPTKFSLILDTGSASMLFTSIVVVIQLVLFFLIGWIRQHGERDQKTLTRVVAVLSLESFLMVIVALYAIVLRISTYGLTVDRIFALLYVGVVFSMAGSLLYVVVRMLRAKADLPSLITGLLAVQFSGVVIFILGLILTSSVLDAEMISARDQIARVRHADKLSVSLDREYFRNASLRVADLMDRTYGSASRQLKADTALTLYVMKENWSRDIEEKSSIQSLVEELYSAETDPDMKAILKALTASDYLVTRSTEVSAYPVDMGYAGSDVYTTCTAHLPKYLSVSVDEAELFCQVDTYRW